MDQQTNPQQNKESMTPPKASVQDIIRRGNEIYEEIKSQLEPTHDGKYVVIETDSKKYFLGETRDEAIANAKEKFPDKVMFIRRVAQLEKASRHLSHRIYQKHAWIL